LTSFQSRPVAGLVSTGEGVRPARMHAGHRRPRRTSDFFLPGPNLRSRSARGTRWACRGRRTRSGGTAPARLTRPPRSLPRRRWYLDPPTGSALRQGQPTRPLARRAVIDRRHPPPWSLLSAAPSAEVEVPRSLPAGSSTDGALGGSGGVREAPDIQYGRGQGHTQPLMYPLP